MELPNNNSIVSYRLGDGFRTALRFMFRETDLVITNKIHHASDPGAYGKAKVVYIHKLPSRNSLGKYTRVVLDTPMVGPKSKSFGQIKVLVRRKPLVIISNSYVRGDSAMILFACTQRNEMLKQVEYATGEIFQFLRDRQNV